MKSLPFTKEKIEEIIKSFPTPFHIYDEKGIRENIKSIKKAFSIFDNFKEYFAIKACPNYQLLKIFKEEGLGADASSLAELLLAEKANILGENIMFSSNETPINEYAKAKELGAIINLDDITHIQYVDEQIGLPQLLSFRYNPGPLRGGNAIIGNPEDAKYGLTREQLFEAYADAKKRGVKRFGLHTMVASNELNYQYFIDTAKMLFDIALEIKKSLDISFDFINASLFYLIF